MTNPPTGIQPRRPRPALKKVPQFVRSYRHVRPKRHAADDPNPEPVAANCALNSRSGASRLTMSRAREQVAVAAVVLLLLYRPAQHLCSRLCFIQDPGVFVKRQRLVDFLPAKPAFLGRPSLPSSRRRLPSPKIPPKTGNSTNDVRRHECRNSCVRQHFLAGRPHPWPLIGAWRIDL